MEGLVIKELPEGLQRLDAQALLSATVADTLDLDDLDRVLSQVPNPDEIELPELADVESSQAKLPAVSASSLDASSRFANPVSEFEIQSAQKSAVPANTQKNTSCAVNVWKQWSEHCRSVL